MAIRNVLVIGAGIGGLTAAIALMRKGFEVDIIERDPEWTVYGVGIIQQFNVVRAMLELDLLDDYLHAGFGYDNVEVFAPSGQKLATIPVPKLAASYPANVGIGRRALQKVLGDRAKSLGGKIQLGVTATALENRPRHVDVTFSDARQAVYDVVVGADGLYSTTRAMMFPDAPQPEFTGQAVWRYNFPRSPDVLGLQAFEGPTGVGLVPLSQSLMYMYLTTPEPDNPRYPKVGIAGTMRAKLALAPPRLRPLVDQITDDDEVVYRPLEAIFVHEKWSSGRIVLIGDAVHATTPHLGQGAGMAIEDSIVLADELSRHDEPEDAFEAFQARRFERCKYIVERSRAIGDGQIGKGPLRNTGAESGAMFEVVAQPL